MLKEILAQELLHHLGRQYHTLFEEPTTKHCNFGKDKPQVRKEKQITHRVHYRIQLKEGELENGS